LGELGGLLFALFESACTAVMALERRSERIQFALAILTLVLLAAEWMIHLMVHRV
jgi:hypothetical protein